MTQLAPTKPRYRRRFLQVNWTYVWMLPMAMAMVIPLVYTVSFAFKPLEELFLFPPPLFPKSPTTDNFQQLVLATSSMTVPFSRNIFNTVVTSVAVMVGTVLIGSLAAYPLAKYPLWGKNFVFAVVISALMFSPEVTQIPRYLIVNELGMIDTFGALIIPNLALPLGLFLMKQFMEGVPSELLEASRIDGASELRIFGQIMMPLTRPAWATLAIFSFIPTWNDYFTPLIFTRSESMKTLTLAMQTIGSGATTVARYGAVFAAAFLVLLPPVVLFIFMQRRVLDTMAYSGIKS